MFLIFSNIEFALKAIVLNIVKYMKIHEKYALQHKKTLYICTVFFMVLDLRLTKDWVVVRQPFLLFIKSSL